MEWQADPQGLSTGGFGLFLQPQDMARLGELYLRRGMWGGRQVLPAHWIDETRRASIDMRTRWAPGLRYANQFWVLPDKGAFMAVGYHGQLIIVMPTLDLVAVATGSARFSDAANVWTRPLYSMGELIDRLARSAKLLHPAPADPSARSHLLARLGSASHQQARPVAPLPEIAGRISGKTYRFPNNAIGLSTLSLTFTDRQEAFYDHVRNGERHVGPIGLDGIWREGPPGRIWRAGPPGPSGVIAAKGTWVDGQFILDHQTLGHDDAVRISHRFDGAEVELSMRSVDRSLKLTGRSGD